MRLDPILGPALCAALIAALFMPVGPFVFALLPTWVGHLPFEAFEAAVSATLGFGIFSVLSG